MSATEDGTKCSWCKSGAVGATCFKETDAKSLPTSVFTCAYQVASYLTATETCDTYRSEGDWYVF